MEIKQSLQGTNNPKKQGCSSVFAYFGWTVWVVIISAADIYWNWMSEQVLFESSDLSSDVRWLNHLVFILVLFIPLIIGFFTAKNPRLKSTLQVWMLAAGFSLAAFPVKRLWITYQQETTVLLMITMLLFVGGFYYHQRRHPSVIGQSKKRSSWGGLAAIVAVAIAFPWFLWGSLGSINDTVLYICLGIVFAYFVVLVLYPYLFDQDQAVEREPKVADFVKNGFVVAIFFLILITAMAQNGSQPLLLIALPPAGWVVAFFALMARDTSGRGKIIVGLIAAIELILPLTWFDADEMSLLITGSAEIGRASCRERV